jgi:hypothetical protein
MLSDGEQALAGIETADAPDDVAFVFIAMAIMQISRASGWPRMSHRGSA